MYILVALKRRKDGNDEERCIRYIARNDEDLSKDINILKAIVDQNRSFGDTWRIYRTVNKRNPYLATKELRYRMLEDVEKVSNSLESTWKTCLLQRKCADEKNILIDIDTTDIDKLLKVVDEIPQDTILQSNRTPNGHHVIIKRSDTRFLDKYDYAEAKKDALFFLTKY